MHNAESIQENETQKIPWYFQIQTNHLIPDRGPDQVILKKKKKEPAE